MQTIRQLSLKLIQNTPGLTATQIAHLIKRPGDSTSSRLCKLCNKGIIRRETGISWRYRNFDTWRYFPAYV